MLFARLDRAPRRHRMAVTTVLITGASGAVVSIVTLSAPEATLATLEARLAALEGAGKGG